MITWELRFFQKETCYNRPCTNIDSNLLQDCSRNHNHNEVKDVCSNSNCTCIMIELNSFEKKIDRFQDKFQFEPIKIEDISFAQL